MTVQMICKLQKANTWIFLEGVFSLSVFSNVRDFGKCLGSASSVTANFEAAD